MIPDPIERAEASAERAYDELSQPGGKFKCYECDSIFDPEKEGGTTSPDPYAMPVCGKCYGKWIYELCSQRGRELELLRKKNTALEKCNGTLMTALERVRAGLCYPDEYVKVAHEALTSHLSECSVCRRRHGNEIQHPCE
jgi:hypothetical protein